MASDQGLLALAESIADGRPVDWQAAEAAVDPEQRAIVRQLRIVSQLAVLHRSLPQAPSAPAADVAAARTATAPLAIGVWGHLQLLERLGGGTSGEVYRAWDPALEREVALKLLRAGHADADLISSRITAEARLLARIRHPNVVAVHGVASHEGRVGLWMDRIHGSTLEAWLSAHGPLSAREAALVGIDLCRALAAIHAAGLVHRDVKTQNVMREAGGRIVLMDLGTGRELDPHHATTAADVAGTPLYLAPELFRGAGASVRTDIYSIGVLLYRLVTGGFPIRAATLEQLRVQHAEGTPIALRDARPDLPSAFVRVVQRAIAPDPAERYASAGLLEADLVRALEADDHTTRPSPAPVFTQRRWSRRGVVVAVAAMLAMMAAGYWYRRPAGLSGVHSIVVLPLANVSGDPAQDYFADGMTEELIGALGRLEGLNVISRTSAMRFKGTQMPVPEIARALRVDAVLEGSVFMVRGGSDPAAPPSRVRVTARLIHAGTDAQIWNQTFEAALTDVMALQGQIAKAVAEGIKLRLNRQTQNDLTQAAHDGAGAQDVAVFDLYLRGRYESNKRTREGLQRGILYFQEAIDRAPKYARPYAGLADAYSMLAVYGHAPRGEAAERATTAASTALTLDDSLAEVHASLGLIAEARFEWSAAEQHFERATALKPGYSSAHHWYADFLTRRNRLKEARAEINAAHALDPLSPAINVVVGSVKIFSRDYDGAVAQLEKAVQIDQRFAMSHLALAEAYGYTKNFRRALAEAEIADAALANPVSAGTKGYILAAAGRRAEAERIADDLAVRYARREPDVAAAAAVVRAGLGQTDDALTWLERAMDRQEPWVGYLAVDPRFDSLRSNPRFAKLLAALGVAR